MSPYRRIHSEAVVLADGRQIPADIVMLATGVHPNTALAEAAGITLGATGAIRVNRQMQTNLPDIYACGDCIETYDVVTGNPFLSSAGFPLPTKRAALRVISSPAAISPFAVCSVRVFSAYLN